ncbi:MAG: MazF family transcriptional regulator [Oceanospirillaceae bacterium]|uniref:type II toxin-antitoxin system PemK/MazF family toxin n=1 Tax=unclassified Thalassolituus TaxID=2624967 RepID=UPI000C562B0F|nr:MULTISPECIES: type II toxin-antitoxin system PemK/MazF family toxin [unclassified Thalassolituus]MBS52891.1 MazF family transcriptional regulator [Oceanospirillaceae bacterium]|tara:strand:- start:252 stop:632 length:381 start_codon:yes stop_codon:yes gene_type:complete
MKLGVDVAGRYIPDRNDIVFLDFEPIKGKEIGKYRPALVLSSKMYNQRSGLLICCPISTSIRGAATEVPIGNLESPSVVASNLINTLDWSERKVKKVAEAEQGVMEEVILRLIPLIGADQVISDIE